MSLLPKSIHRCRRYPTKFNSGRDIPDQAFGVDCEEIPFEFFPDVETGFPPYVKGFLVVESDLSLDVIAVYTAGDLMSTGVGSIDVEDVRERRINQRRDDRDDDSSSDDDSSGRN